MWSSLKTSQGKSTLRADTSVHIDIYVQCPMNSVHIGYHTGVVQIFGITPAISYKNNMYI